MADIEVTLLDHMGSDLAVVDAARVSFAKESAWDAAWDPETGSFAHSLSKADRGLIAYLAKHQHKSPFNHAFLKFRVKAPVFVARQLVKHEYMPWNEVSRRYVDSEPEFYTPETWRKRAENVKQGSSDEAVDLGYLDPGQATASMCAVYRELLNLGVCPEQARMVLPQSLMTEWLWSGSLYAFAKMLNLRLDPHSQLETRRVAELIEPHVARLFPVSWKALKAGGT